MAEDRMYDADRPHRDAIRKQLAVVCKALSSTKRLELLDLVRQGHRSVGSLARETGLSVANASQHLLVLRAARLVKADRNGHHVVCRVADENVGALCSRLESFAENQLNALGKVYRKGDACM